MTKQQMKVPVTTRAVVQRINRKLAGEGRLGRKLKATRGGRWRSTVGDFYVLDIDRNLVVEQHVNPEALARKLGVLEPWEQVHDEQHA